MGASLMQAALRITHDVYDRVLAHCQRAYPKEACGILAGFGKGMSEDVAPLAVQAYPMINVEGSPIGYAMDPKEQLRIEKQMRRRNERMMAIYHSHTASEAYPSSVDVNLAISPDISYVLVSLKDTASPVVRSYRIVDGNILEEDLLIVPEPL